MTEPFGTKTFGSWKSPLDAQALTRGVKGFADLQVAAGMLFLLESRPEEAGRSTLLMLDPTQPDATPVELTPAPLNVRSRVHEYGGGSFIATPTQVIFVNFADQNIYRVALAQGEKSIEPGPPAALTNSDADTRFADFAVTPDEQTLIMVCEQHSEHAHEPQNLLTQLSLTATSADNSFSVVHEGHDFYAAPRISPDGSELAFIVWDHPNMPWDETELLRTTLSTGATVRVAGGNNTSVTQPNWYPTHAERLGFIADNNGFWNLYTTQADATTSLHADKAEYASPAWVFGQREWLVLADESVVCVRQHHSGSSLCLLAPGATGEPEVLNDAYAGYSALCVHNDRLWCIAEKTDGFACLLGVDLAAATGSITGRELRQAGELNLAAVSAPEALSIKNRNGETTYAWFYPPLNLANDSEQAANTDQTTQRPPLLVLSHGGPTSACSPALNLRIQYYTSRGWAVADVNYAGSTGFGRAYRERLRDQWGIADVADCEDVATQLAAAGRVDPKRMAIKGGSAGGYTTLAALTFGDVFAAGASHYGIGDLNALASDTHKFEARYVDGLVPKTEWDARSPINSVDSLACPVIFFQGADDAVVPPNQAQAMVAALRKKDLPVAYIEFPGEGHGFRQAKNIQHAVRAEYQFFCTIFAIDCPDAPIDLTIENLP